MAYMSIGTGISSTFVLNGVAWPGAHGAAILLGSGSLGPRPNFGSRPYILEELASGTAIVASYRSLGGHDPHAVIVGGLGSVDGPYWRCLQATARAHIWAEAARDVPLLRSVLGPDAAAIGAALAAATADGE